MAMGGRRLLTSEKTAWVLSSCLLLTLLTQVILIVHHDEFVMQVDSWEHELEGNLVQIDSELREALGAVHEYNGGAAVAKKEAGLVAAPPAGHAPYRPDTAKGGRGPFGQEIKIGKATKLRGNFTSYSMEPADILERAGVDYKEGYVPSISVREMRALRKSNLEESAKQKATLPSLEDIQQMYGADSHIVGLDRCEAFRDAVEPEFRIMGPAGLFNSATNLLNKLLKLNCSNEVRRRTKKYKAGNTGMLLQAPWGKHNPVFYRMNHVAKVGGAGIDQSHFLPIVMIKDPVTWMASMCRHPYEARWRHDNRHCPNLVPNKFDRGRTPGEGSMGIKVKFATKRGYPDPVPDDPTNKTFVDYESLAHLWSEWYRDWYDADFPRLVVRFEDLMFHAEESISKVCDCIGGTMRPNFRYVEDSAKGQGGPHMGSAGFLASLISYGNITLRNQDILKDGTDRAYAREHLDKELMEIFGYAPIE